MDYNEAVCSLMASPQSPHHTLVTDEARFSRRAGFFLQLCPTKLKYVPYYHIAGTNGKGSVCELIRACLHSNGQRVGTFTSPHVHTFRERIRVGESLIPRDAVVRYATSLESTFNDNPWLLFFDKILAVALLHFDEMGIDTLVLEVGIGGKYDSTNFFLHPAIVSVITSISYDHQALLGDTLESIAEQKAGVIKTGTAVLCCTSMPTAAKDVIDRTAKVQNARLTLVDPAGLDVLGGCGTWALPENLGLAQSALAHSGVPLTSMARASWPCRFEEFKVGDDGRIVILDGAHNADAIKRLLERAMNRYPSSPLQVVFGAAMDKSLEFMLGAVVCTNANVILVRASHPRAASTSTLLDIGLEEKQTCIDLASYKDDMSVEDGLQLAMRPGTAGGIAIVCGSLYVAAQARQWLAHEHPLLFNTQDWVHQSDN